MKDIVLAIDDSPERYEHLSDKLAAHNILLVPLQNPTGARIILRSNRVLCVLLDHDMPSVCPETGDVFHDWSGQYFANEVLPVAIPVVITSANRVGAAKIADIILDQGGSSCRISVIETAAEERWLGFILDLYLKQL